MVVDPVEGGDGVVDVATMVPGDGESDFISDVSGGDNGGRGGSLSGAESVDAAAPAAQSTAVGNGNNAAQRAISEADILQLNGDRLYALSRFSGLSIIDVSNPQALRLEGVYRTAAEPFEMYVQDGLVFAMFNGWYSYQCNEQGVCSWQQTSRMQAIDARNPADIQLLADHEVPGAISDSRRVGDVLYLATHEWGGCWGCQTVPNTTVTSFNVANPTELTQVDQLRLPSPPETYLGERSISVTDERMYISGWEWRNNGNNQTGSIQVVDISDPYGALVQGDKFDIAGQIQSRWQMDEYDGVLRVISQPGGWGNGQEPVLETFTVNSSADLVRAGRLTMQLPRANEVLQSARFDGERAYAITFEQRDPLLTFDLSDPANPTQRGMLEMPGFVYHMEPRGDRMYALGFDQENPAGALNVSLFNVADLDNPLLLSRVNFGGDWGSFAEGQNQIHKAFTILEDQGTILVPYSGGSYDEATCTSSYGSGIQLVDIGQDTLVGRGVAPQVGSARRALMHRDHLFGIGDNAVQTFDISNRDAPVETGQLDVARNVSAVRVLGDHLMRFGVDWWTQQTVLDVTPLAQAGDAEPQAEIDLSQVIGSDSWSCGGGASWGGEVFTKGNFAYVPRYSYTQSAGTQYGGYQYQQQVTFYTVDMSDRAQPRVVGSFTVDPIDQGDSWFAGIVQTDNTLLVGRSQGHYRWSDNEIVEKPRFSYDVIDLTDPGSPRVAERFQVPASIAGGGWGYFPGGCSLDMGWGWYGGGGYGNSVALTDGDLVVSQHTEPLDDDSGRVRYYLDRIDLSNPDRPVVLPKVNIPGTALHFNADTGEVITVDYVKSNEAGRSWEDCNIRGAYGYYVEQGGYCEVYRRSLNTLVLEGNRAVRTSQLWLDQTRRVNNIAVSDTRVFLTTTEFPDLSDGSSATPYFNGPQPAVELSPVMLETMRLEDGQLLRLPSTELRQLPNQYWYGGQLVARGERVFETFDNRLTVVDTTEGLPTQQMTHELPGWGCGSLEVSGDTAYCAIGQRGVEVIDMSALRR
ncbi:MAG: hypothetical protein RL685_2008 [Pseudomonadota bacterium]